MYRRSDDALISKYNHLPKVEFQVEPIKEEVEQSSFVMKSNEEMKKSKNLNIFWKKDVLQEKFPHFNSVVLNPFKDQYSNSGAKFNNETPEFDHSLILRPRNKHTFSQSQINIFNFKSLPKKKINNEYNQPSHFNDKHHSNLNLIKEPQMKKKRLQKKKLCSIKNSLQKTRKKKKIIKRKNSVLLKMNTCFDLSNLI